jgi:hypothetical protein
MVRRRGTICAGVAASRTRWGWWSGACSPDERFGVGLALPRSRGARADIHVIGPDVRDGVPFDVRIALRDRGGEL